jgi:thiamine biosynthesis lipoprotein
VGACGKGYLVDLVGGLLEHRLGVDDYVVDAGSDLRRGPATPALRVGLEDPEDAARALGVIEWDAVGLAASATTRRSWGHGLHHILGGRSGRPVAEVLATWATAESCARADPLATAMFVAGPAEMPQIAALAGEGCALLTSDRRLIRPVAFPGEVFDAVA